MLVLDTLDNGTQIEMILSVLRHPRWLKQVQSCAAVAGIIGNKCHQGKRALYDQELRFINVGEVLGKNCQEYFDLSWQRHFGFACLGTLDITKGEKL